jgi:hypothetical protein
MAELLERLELALEAPRLVGRRFPGCRIFSATRPWRSECARYTVAIPPTPTVSFNV